MNALSRPSLNRFTVLSLFAAVFSLQVISADVVLLKNGDRLSGTVKRMEGEKLELKTSYAGTIKISWDEVSNVDLDEPQQLLVRDDVLIDTSAVARQEGGKVRLTTPSGEQVINEKDLRVLNPSADELGEKGKFTGRFNLSWKDEKGNTDKKDLDADYQMTYRKGDHRFNSRGAIEYDDRDGAESKRDWSMLGSYGYYWTEKMFGGYLFLAKQEKEANLSLRQVTGPSIGYHFFDDSQHSLLSQLGMYYINERYTNESTDVFWGPGWHLEYEQKLFDEKLTFYHNHSFLTASDDISKVLWQSWTGFRYPIAGGIVGSLEYEFDYDSRPANRSKKLDQTTRLKLGYEW